MSVIQKMRDKYATVVVIAICVSLVAFLLMDAFVGPKSFFHRSNEVGIVDGQGLEYREFANEMQSAENDYRTRTQGANIDDATRAQLRDQVWNKFLSGVLLGNEYSTLGIGFSEAEMSDLTVSPDADPQIQGIRDFQDPQTGRFDPNRVIMFLRQLSQQPAEVQGQWLQLEDYLRSSSMQRKFFSMIRNAVYYPKWLQEMDQQDKNTSATIAYVGVPYSSISDSSVKVTDDELNQYISAHQGFFHQEASRRVEYVSFDAIPTAADSAAIMKQIDTLKSEMNSTSNTDISGFINRNSDVPYSDIYVPQSQLQLASPQKEAVEALPAGAIYGPFYTGGMVAFVKMVDKKSMPDTVKIRHIIISEQTTPDSIAKKELDSVATALKGGADFRALADKYSEDPSKVQNGGEYTLTPLTQFTPEGKDYAFQHKKGDIGVVKIQGGYQLIQVVDQQNFEPAIKIAVLAKHMDASQDTDNSMFSAANEFAGKNRTRQAFDKSALQQGLNKRVADVKQTDFEIPAIGQARELVRWAFNDAKKGDVSNVFSLDNKYVVAVLTDIREEGTSTLDQVRQQVTAEVRREKKAQQIADKMKSASTLEAVAGIFGQQVKQAQNVNFNTPFIPDAGFEPKVVGATFDKALGTKKISGPIFGNSGVFMIQVDSLATQPADSAGLEQQQLQQTAAWQNAISSQVFQMLKKQSKITDNRLKFF